MGDIRIVWDPATGTGDLNMLTLGMLETGNDLETASLISMFTDAQADLGDIVYGTDPAGVWFDTYSALEDPALATIAKDRIGSKLYQAFARPRTQETLNWLRDEIIRCHDWMITDGVASAVDANAFFTGPGGIGATVTIAASGVANVFSYVWAQGS